MDVRWVWNEEARAQEWLEHDADVGALFLCARYYNPAAGSFLAWCFAYLRQCFRPFHKGLEDFSGVCIQSGVAENPFLPSRLT